VAREAIFIGKKTYHFNHLRVFFREFLLRLLILVAREGFLKGKCGPRAKKFEHHCLEPSTEFQKKFYWISSVILFYLNKARRRANDACL